MIYTSSGHPKSNKPTSSLGLLICGFALQILVPSIEFGLLFL
jgi:hypothetical protein